MRGSICNHWVGIVYNVRVTHPTNNLQYVHELTNSIHRNLLGITLVRVHVEGTGTSIDDDTGQILVTFINGVVRVVVLVHGWSVLYSLIIGYRRCPVKRGCDTCSTVHKVFKIGTLNQTSKCVNTSFSSFRLTNLHSICPDSQVKFIINLRFDCI